MPTFDPGGSEDPRLGVGARRLGLETILIDVTALGGLIQKPTGESRHIDLPVNIDLLCAALAALAAERLPGSVW